MLSAFQFFQFFFQFFSVLVAETLHRAFSALVTQTNLDYRIVAGSLDSGWHIWLKGTKGCNFSLFFQWTNEAFPPRPYWHTEGHAYGSRPSSSCNTTCHVGNHLLTYKCCIFCLYPFPLSLVPPPSALPATCSLTGCCLPPCCTYNSTSGPGRERKKQQQ